MEDQVSGRIKSLLDVRGHKTVTEYHRELGHILWDKVGIARNAQGLAQAAEQIRALRAEYRDNVKVAGQSGDLNKDLEHALRVDDFMEFGELMATDALDRAESCGCHLREESQTPEGEAMRDDLNYSYVSAWEHRGEDAPTLHKEQLDFEFVEVKMRNYK